MHTIDMTMQPIQFNTKFVNHLQPEWSKFIMDVKLLKYMHNTKFDQLFAHLIQHEAHANKVHLMKHRYPDLIALAPKNSAWFREKMLLTEALDSGAILDEEQLAFLEDNVDTVIPAQASQEIPSPAIFQTDDLDAFDSDCDDVPSAKAILMANLSS
ncbi:hypothetical protein Tco_0503828 [Tanacetum coccineum]